MSDDEMEDDRKYYSAIHNAIHKAKELFYDEMNKQFTGDYLAITIKIDVVSSDYSGILESMSYTNTDNLLIGKNKLNRKGE